MGYSIKEFSEAIQGHDLLKPTHYTVDIVSPVFTKNDIYAESVTIPGRSISTQERRTFGPQREMPYERLFAGDLDITFMFSANDMIRTHIENWMDAVITEKNIINREWDDYTGTIKISVDYPDNGPAWTCEVMDVYPKTVSPVQLGYGMANDYLRQAVSFAFREYKIV